VVKNTLTKIAAKDAGVTAEFTQLLAGPSAIAFVGGDVVQAARGLRDFAKTNPLLVIKGGVLDGKIMTPGEISQLADLESREVLLAKLAGAMKASMAGAAATFAALPVQMARLLAALAEKRAAEAPVEAAAEAEVGDGADVAVPDDGAAAIVVEAAASDESASAESASDESASAESASAETAEAESASAGPAPG
jgi:large subunit ribosomal protein L10